MEKAKDKIKITENLLNEAREFVRAIDKFLSPYLS